MLKKYLISLIMLSMFSLASCKITEVSGSSDNDSTPDIIEIEGTVIDAATNLPAENMAVGLYDTYSGALISTVLTDASGYYVFDTDVVRGETYDISIPEGAYKMTTAQDIVVPSAGNKVLLVDFYLVPTTNNWSIASICGKVKNSSGEPLRDVAVSISGGDATNGIFASALTDNNGNYSLKGIVLEDIDDFSLTDFTLSASGKRYNYNEIAVVGVNASSTVANSNIILSAFNKTSLYSYNLEGENPFTSTGMWHLITTPADTTAAILNSAVPTYVTLPEDDTSEGEIYGPFSESNCYWYGSDTTGNYIGTQSASDFENSGGISTTYNSGELTSGLLDLTTVTNAYLEFKSLFEIESVEPNESGYDHMDVEISTDGVTFTSLKRLNPYLKVYVDSRDNLCLSSGGFNRVAQWATYRIDLTPYVGNNVAIRFSFNTIDNLYNGFRGWFIDDFKVYYDRTL